MNSKNSISLIKIQSSDSVSYKSEFRARCDTVTHSDQQVRQLEDETSHSGTPA